MAIARADNPIIDLGEHFVKQSARNRFYIGNAQGRQLITLNVKGTAKRKVAIGSCEIADDFQSKLIIRSLDTAYGKSPFYEHYRDEFHELFYPQGNKLIDYTLPMFKWLQEELELDGISISQEYNESFSKDFRNHIADISEEVPYSQTFEDRNGFVEGLSMIDVLFHLGPETEAWFKSQV
ncbi:MAG: WbqC family protein [Bacteroidota bacterium]